MISCFRALSRLLSFEANFLSQQTKVSRGYIYDAIGFTHTIPQVIFLVY